MTDRGALVEVRPGREASLPAPAPGGSVAQLRVFRGEPGSQSRYDAFDVPVEEGMVVLDALHWIQGNGAPDLAVRWNCKAAKCGSCGAEVDGRPRLTCKTRLTDFDLEQPITGCFRLSRLAMRCRQAEAENG